ncbi:MAG: cyanobacterial phytochrome A, partial [Cyanobacteria bacterium P01_A01_bin.135]
MVKSIFDNLDAESAQAADLSNCDREPIHIPGLIQPHGVLLVLSGQALTVVQVSHSLAELTGCQPEALLNRPLSLLLGDKQVEKVQRCLAEDFESINPLKLTLTCDAESALFDGIVHRNGEVILLELEPQSGQSNFFEFYQQVHGTVTRLQKAATLQAMCQTP